jgi:ABC-type glycerol-3-phosphate transport system substrate-binding protein
MTRVRSCLATAGVLLLAACGGGEDTTASQPKEGASSGSTAADAEVCGTSEDATITFSNSVSTTQTAEDWQVMVDRFTAACPNVTVNMLTPPTADRDAYVKQLLASGNFPDVSYALQVAQFKEHLTPFDADDPQYDKIKFKDALLEDGELWQLGTTVQPWNVIFYNKELFEKAEVEPPTTREEFEENLKTIKDAGITPMLTAGEWVPVNTFMNLFPIFAEQECWYGDRAAGDVQFTDPEWIESAKTFQSWLDAGYFNEGPLGIGYTQVEQLFREGEAAMYPMGAWFAGAEPPPFEAGVFAMPTSEGEPGALTGSIGSVGYTVAKQAKSPEAAVAFATFMAFNPENHRDLLEQGGGISALDLGEETIEPKLSDLNNQVQELVDKAPSFYTAYNGQGDCNIVPGMQEELNGAVQQVMTGKDPEEAFGKADAFWDKAK